LNLLRLFAYITPWHAPQRRAKGIGVIDAPKTLSETKFVYLKTKSDSREQLLIRLQTVKRRYSITPFFCDDFFAI